MRSLLVLALAACSPQLQTVQLVNKTSRQIEQVFVYPIGSPDHGPSRTSLAPNATTSLQLAQGNLEVMAVSVKIMIDEHTRDRPTASGGVELRGPMQVIFYDADAKPPEVDRPGVIGVPFTIRASNASPDLSPRP